MNIGRMKLTFGVAALAFLAGCAGIEDDRIGSGPITLSPRTQAAFEEYLNVDEPLVFAVTADGRTWGYSLCELWECQLMKEETIAIEFCRKGSDGKPCYIYAMGTKIVWRNE